jgi:hypothetical protein
VATDRNWKRRCGVNLADDLDVLLAKLCVDAGFCNRLRGANLLRGRDVLTADEFACAVLKAEGMAPEGEPKSRQSIARRFLERYGPSVSPESWTPGAIRRFT